MGLRFYFVACLISGRDEESVKKRIIKTSTQQVTSYRFTSEKVIL